MHALHTRIDDLQSMAGFSVMMLIAKRLPIALIPEQLFITPVRYDMIDYPRQGYLLLFQVLDARWMPLEIQIPGPHQLLSFAQEVEPPRRAYM